MMQNRFLTKETQLILKNNVKILAKDHQLLQVRGVGIARILKAICYESFAKSSIALKGTYKINFYPDGWIESNNWELTQKIIEGKF